MRHALRTTSLGLAVFLLFGCTGQGNYTREGVSLAKERMSVMKSATEWEMARQAFLAGELEKALRKVDGSLSLNENVTKSHVLRGRIMIEMGELGQALRSLQVAQAIDPQDPDAQYYLGIVFERLARPEDAYTHFQAACELDEYNPGYAVAAAEMLVDLERDEEARQYLLSLPMAVDNAGVRQMLGHIALIQELPEDAVGYFGEARLLAPDDAGIHEDLIRAQMEVGQFSQAEMNISSLRQHRDHRERPDLMLLHAETYLAIDRPVEARTIYNELLSDPSMTSDPQIWIGLGNSAYMIEDYRTLRRAASRAIAVAPEYHEGYALFALVHRHNGDLGKAVGSIDEAIKRNPNDAALYGMRAVTLADMGRTSEALASVREALRIAPGTPSLAALQYQLGSGTYASAPTE